MRYIIFVIDQQTNTADSDERAAIDAFNESLESGGHWVTAGGIADPSKATVIDNRSGAGLAYSGSLFDSDNFYSGFWIIEAESDARALELASAGSKACNRRAELRPFLR
jgi:hypothetical protein